MTQPRSFHALNALFDSLGQVVNPNSCDVVVIDGHLDHARLRAAIARTLARHPILCRPLGARDGVDHALPIDLRFHALPDEPARVDAHLLQQIWDEPLARGERPVRFHVTETPTRTYLQTIHTHVYADATACYTLTAQLAAAYAGHVPSASTSGDAPLAWPRRDAWRARLGDLRDALRGLRDRFAGLAVPVHRPGHRRMTRVVLTERETARLRQVARSRGHSIHATFQLAMLRAAHAFNAAHGIDRPTVRLWDFFSLRPMLEPQSEPRYDCLALVYPVDLDARESDAETTARAAAIVQRMRGGELADHARRFDAMFRAVGRRSPMPGFARLWPALFKSNVFLTNPGVCPSNLPRFGDAPVLDYVTFPQLFAPADVMFVFSTFRDRLRIHVVYDEAAFGDRFHAELLRPFLRELDAQAGLHLDGPHRDGFVASWTARSAPPSHDRTPRPEARP